MAKSWGGTRRGGRDADEGSAVQRMSPGRSRENKSNDAHREGNANVVAEVEARVQESCGSSRSGCFVRWGRYGNQKERTPSSKPRMKRKSDVSRL